MTLEIIERLAAAQAAPQRLARGRAELGQYFGVLGAALRARHLLRAEQRASSTPRLRWGNAIFAELAAAVLAHPIGGPGRRQHSPHLWIAKALAFEGLLDFQRDHVHRGTPGIGRRDRNLDAVVGYRDVAKHPEIGD